MRYGLPGGGWKDKQREVKKCVCIFASSFTPTLYAQGFIVQPYVLDFDDITEDANDWRNRAIPRRASLLIARL